MTARSEWQKRYAEDSAFAEAQRAKSRLYAQRNADKINAARRAARKADPVGTRATDRERRKRGLEKARARDRRYHQKNRPRQLEKARRNRLSRYGLTVDGLAALIASQDGKCAICSEPFSSRQHTHVDHDHRTGHVRGVLCQLCNLLIGHAKEDPRTLRRAIAYLERNAT